MEVDEVDPNEYQRIFYDPYVVFNSVRFSQLNAQKCESVKYLVFSEGKSQLGLIAGLRKDELFSPFSAPYGGFIAAAHSDHISIHLQAIELLEKYAKKKKARAIHITLPPTFYDETFVSKQASALINGGYSLVVLDLNSIYYLSDFNESYIKNLPDSAKWGLKKSLRSELVFSTATDRSEKELCYQIQKENRELKGRQIKMTFQEVLSTSDILPADFFLVRNQEDAIASAIVFQVNPSVAQVIFWGALPKYNSLQPSNFLAFKLWEFYKHKDIKIIDIGPSSNNGVPDPGLVKFKESLGCKLSLKFSFYREFTTSVIP
jgi:hypothetical protein